MELLVATKNAGKFREYQDLLQGLPVHLVSLTDAHIEIEVEETGQTFAQNAILKAQAYAAQTGLATLADDSGLEVDALNGEPGVFSARYGGRHGTDASRYLLLLDKMRDIPWERRGARFRCVIALALPDGSEPEAIGDGRCEGFIAPVPRGTYGFGYDPVFFVPQFGRSMAELSSDIKNQISHRARAAVAVRRVLMQKFFPGLAEQEQSAASCWHISETRIRTARPSDAPDLQRHCCPEQPFHSPERWLRWATSDSNEGKRIPLVVESDGEVIASMSLHVRSTVATLSDLCVAAQFRRRGIATALLNVGREITRDHSIRLLTVTVDSKDKRLQTFYQTQGFTPYKTVRKSEHGYTGAVVHMKRLLDNRASAYGP